MKKSLFCSLVAALVFLSFFQSSCDKDDSNTESSERFMLLTTHEWKFDEIITICKDPEIVWFINELDDAFKGETIVFSSDYSFQSPVEQGKWKFNNQETEIITFDDDDPSDIYGHFRIDLLTTEILELLDLADVIPSDTCYVKSRLVK